MIPTLLLLFIGLLLWFFFFRDGALIDQWIRKMTDYSPQEKYRRALDDLEYLKNNLLEWEERQREQKEQYKNDANAIYLKQKLINMHKGTNAAFLTEGEDCIDCGDFFQTRERCYVCRFVVMFKEDVRRKKKAIAELELEMQA